MKILTLLKECMLRKAAWEQIKTIRALCAPQMCVMIWRGDKFGGRAIAGIMRPFGGRWQGDS